MSLKREKKMSFGFIIDIRNLMNEFFFALKLILIEAFVCGWAEKTAKG